VWTVVAIVGIALQLVLIGAVAYLIRLVRHERADAQVFRSTVRRRTSRIVEQGARSRKRDEAARLAQYEKHLITQRQGQAWSNLMSLVRLDAAVPPAGGWAASPDLLLRMVDELLVRRPAVVVECGSGLSTVMLALAVEQHGLPTKVIALEHDADYAASTRALLERHGVARHADVRVAPLGPTGVAGHETPWYDVAALDGLAEIGMLLVDGPPTTTGPLARYPAVPLLKDRLADRALILMDDMQRPSDQDTAARWQPLLTDFDYRLETAYEKHLGVFSRG
jgi:protein-L-isoaspartate O-methyltransferase